MIRYQGVCGELHATSETPVGCGRPFTLCVAELTLWRWHHTHPTREWRLTADCPDEGCDHRCVDIPVGRKEADRLIDHGVNLVQFQFDSELDEPRRRTRRAGFTDVDAVRACQTLENDEWLRQVVALFARKYPA